jgi:predicted component of type VI protein secretion system
MNVSLVVQNGPGRLRKITLRSSEAVVGRRRGNQIRIPSADVSRNHARLSVQDGYVVVEDLGSFNGTFLNGERISGLRPVRPGDRIEIGPVVFLVEYELNQAALQALNQRFPGATPAPAAPDADEPIPLAGDDQPLGVDLVEEEEELVQPILLSEDEILEEVHEAAPDEITADFDDQPSWQLPDPDQLRDILKKMEKPKGG